MIDLHSHILPGIDDGARDIEHSLRMCASSYRDGCRAMVATPHLRHERYWNDDRALLEQQHRLLCQAVLLSLGPDFQVLLGGEIAVSSESLLEIDQMPAGSLLSLAGSRYLLLELSHHGMGPDPVEMVHELRIAGWRPILAHPERIAWLAADSGLLAAMIDHGAHLQLTAMSLTGDFGPAMQNISRRMMDKGWVHFIASDCHDNRLRPPTLSAAREAVQNHWGHEVGNALFEENPRAVLEDRPLAPNPSIQSGSIQPTDRPSSWQRLRSKLWGTKPN